MPAVEFRATESVFHERLVAGVSSSSGENFADVADGRVRRGAVEPDSPDAGLQTIFAELVVLGSVDDLAHVRILHGQDHVGGRLVVASHFGVLLEGEATMLPPDGLGLGCLKEPLDASIQ